MTQPISVQRDTFCDGVFSIFHMTFKLIKPALLPPEPKQKDKPVQPYFTNKVENKFLTLNLRDDN